MFMEDWDCCFDEFDLLWTHRRHGWRFGERKLGMARGEDKRFLDFAAIVQTTTNEKVYVSEVQETKRNEKERKKKRKEKKRKGSGWEEIAFDVIAIQSPHDQRSIQRTSSEILAGIDVN